MTQMLELSDSDFKTTIFDILKHLLENLMICNKRGGISAGR